VGHRGPDDGDDAQESLQPGEIGRIRGEEGKLLRDRSRSKHQVNRLATRFATRGDHGGYHPAKDPCRFDVERNRIELVLHSLQNLQATRSFFVLVVAVLLVVAAA
jgi:hypothetical protein